MGIFKIAFIYALIAISSVRASMSVDGIKRKRDDLSSSILTTVSNTKKIKRVKLDEPETISDSDSSADSVTTLIRLGTVNDVDYPETNTGLDCATTIPTAVSKRKKIKRVKYDLPETISDSDSDSDVELAKASSVEIEADYWIKVLNDDFDLAKLMKIQGVFLSGSLENYRQIKDVLSKPDVNEGLLKHLSTVQPHIFFQDYDHKEVNIFEGAHVNQVKFFVNTKNFTVHMNIFAYACKHPELELDDSFFIFNRFGIEGSLKRIETAKDKDLNCATEYIKKCYVLPRKLVEFDETSALYGRENVLTKSIKSGDIQAIQWILLREDSITILDTKANDEIPIVTALLVSKTERSHQVIGMIFRKYNRNIWTYPSVIDIMFQSNRLDETLEFFIFLILKRLPEYSAYLLSELRYKYKNAVKNVVKRVISFFVERRCDPFYAQIVEEPEPTLLDY